MNLLMTILGCAGNVAAVLLLAPLCEGVLRKVTARVQSRQGPPLAQPYFDLLKLLGKEDLESGDAPVAQRAAAYSALAVVLTVACFIPLGGPAPLGEVGDAILLIYLVTLCGITTLIAGLSAGSTYSLMGMSREMMAMLTLEPLFAVTLVAGAVHTDSLRLGAVLKGSAFTGVGWPWSGAILGVVMLLAFPAFVQRVPFDTAAAETELMDGPLLEYSGPKLALFKYAHMAKVVVYSALFIALFVPWGAHLPWPLGWLVFGAKLLLLVLLVTVVAATHARYRIDQALGYFARLLAVSLGALGLACWGW